MELSQYVKILRSHWVTIVVSTLAGAALSAGWLLFQPQLYKADATGTVVAQSSADDASNALLYENLAKSKVKSYMQWAKTRGVAEYAIEKLDIGESPESVVQAITVENPEDTPVIRVYAKAESPAQARDLATAWLEGLADEGAKQANPQDKGESVLELRVTESAGLPEHPVSPNYRAGIVIGILAGLLVGLSIAYLRSVLDRRLRTARQIEDEFQISVIGSVPFNKTFQNEQRIGTPQDGTDSRREAGAVAVNEAMRELRTNLQYVRVDDPPRTILMTSPLPRDGKSTVTANLARAIATAGQRVIVVDADLRRPTVAKTFGVIETVGITDVLAGRAELSDVLQPWGSTGNLFVLGAGKIPPNPSELLGSRSMKQVISDLSEFALVLIDAPPLLPVTDSAILSNSVDGTLVVVRSGKTKDEALAGALGNLKRVGREALGVVLNGAPTRGPDSPGYGYGYYEPSRDAVGVKRETSRRQKGSTRRQRAKTDRVG